MISKSDVKYFDGNKVCKLLAGVGLEQGKFVSAGRSDLPNQYTCGVDYVKKLTCPETYDCSTIIYEIWAIKEGVTSVNLTYRANSLDNGKNKDAQEFIKDGEIFTKSILGKELDANAKKKIFEALKISGKKDDSEVFRENVGNSILTINTKTFGPESRLIKRRIVLSIYADEYWTNADNEIRTWGGKQF